MAAFRYWRLYISQTGGNSSVAIGELIMATTPAGAQAATGGTASASATNGANAASRAFDGTTSSGNYWQGGSEFNSGQGMSYLQYDMGVGVTLDPVEIRVYFTSTPGATAYPSDMVLLGSDDAQNWTVQRGWCDLSFTNGETKTLDATALSSGDIYNREIKRQAKYNAAANSGSPSYFTVLPRAGNVVVRHGTAPAAPTPYTGGYYISGDTTLMGDPAPRRVDLIDQKSGLLARRVHTGADGLFAFEDIGAGPWTVLGVNNDGSENSVVYAHITPEPMP